MSQEALLQEIDDVIAVYEQIIGTPASRTREMIARYGHVGALSRLTVSADLQKGFRILRDRDQLDMTFEAVIVRHAELFRLDVVEAANWRLENAHRLN